MSTTPSQVTSINERITERSERRTYKSPTISRLTKERSPKKIISQRQLNDKLRQSGKRIFNDNEISEQILKEMKQIEQVLSEIKPQLQQIQNKNKERPIMEILFDLQQRIKNKNHLLTQINNLNKELKSANKKGIRYNTQDPYNDSQQLNPQKQQKTFKLAHELKQQRQELVKVKNMHFQKKKNLQMIKVQTQKLQLEYVERCKKTKQKPLTYEMFKCLNEEKKKELNNQIDYQERKGKRRETLKEMLKSNSFQNNSTKQKAQKNLKQIVNRKKIAQQALKTARKKYNQEISEFYAKLQFLREEDLALVQTLREKQVEFYTLENKFNQSRRNGTKPSSQYHKMGQTMRYRGEYQEIDQLIKTRKTKIPTHQQI